MGCEEVVKIVQRINRKLLLVRDLSRETSVRWHHKLSCVMFVKCSRDASTFSRSDKQSAASVRLPSCIFCDETAQLHEVISPLSKWDGNAFTQGIQQHARRLCTSNGTNNRACILLTWNLYCTLQKMRSTIWVSGISMRGKKKQKGTRKRKYAPLTTDLRNAAANKKIIWAE